MQEQLEQAPRPCPGGRIISALLSQPQDTLGSPLPGNWYGRAYLHTSDEKKCRRGRCSSSAGPQSTELGGGDPVLGLFANPGLVSTLPTLEDPLPEPLKNTSLSIQAEFYDGTL